MSLKSQLEQVLAATPLFSSGEQPLDVADGGAHLSCRLVALDTLACAFTNLTLRSVSLQNRSAGDLKRIAENLSAKLTYLLEPISPIETDAHGCVVQMRSNPPQKDADRTSYYELLVAKTGELSLVRYTRAVGQTREVIPTQLTREVFCRLAGDMSAAAA
jgi:hypothetical protein